MIPSRLTMACIALISIGSTATGQENPFLPQPGPRQIPEAGGQSEKSEPEDLKLMKRSKWVVTSVERDGQTVPAQYGQRKGDVISFKMDDTGNTMFG